MTECAGTNARNPRLKRCLWPLAGVAAAALLLWGAWAVEYERPVPESKLPVAARAFLDRCYPESGVVLARCEVEELRVRYVAFFADGTRIEFRRNGEWLSVESRIRPVPSETLPAPIADFVARNFAGVQVCGIARDRRGWEVELTNSVELTFDRKHLALVDYDD